MIITLTRKALVLDFSVPIGLSMVPPQHPQCHIDLGCFLGTFLLVLLSTCSDACGMPPTFDSMQLVGNPKASYGAGERVEYTCKPGYIRRPSLNVSSVCAASGQWSTISKNACSKKSCPRHNDPLNGQITFVNGSIEFGTQIQFVCNMGFYLIGSKILHCLRTGSTVQWSDEPPLCEKILCEPPPSINNGTFSPSHKDVFEYNEVATYRCDSTSGEDELSLVGESQIHCADQRLWSSGPPECKVVKCPYPVIKNGKLRSGFRKKYYYNARVMFQCNDGLFLHGSDMAVCESNNTWHPPIPTCRKEAPPPSPTKATTTTDSPNSAVSASPFFKYGPLGCEGSNGMFILLIIMTLLEFH